MSNITKLANSTDTQKSLALIKRTVAADCNDSEFELFIWTARHLQLDPLRKQIYAIVYNKDKPDRRKMAIVTAIDGFRAISDRTGDYRPDDEAPEIEFDETLKGPTNPAGIVKATVRLYKFSHGDWHKVTAEARWNEFVPLTEEWAYDQETNKRKPTGKVTLDPKSNWFKMPTVMICKCAESQAHRRAWPDAFSGVNTQEEMDKSILEMSASEAAEEGMRQERAERAGIGQAILMVFDDSGKLEPIPYGKVADRCFAYIESNKEEPSQILLWQDRNQAALKEFWTRNASEALEVKKKIEQVTGVR